MTTTTAGITPAAATAALPHLSASDLSILTDLSTLTDLDTAVSAASANLSRPEGAPSALVPAPLSWLETAVAILAAARRPLRAREIVDKARELGCTPPSRSKTPWQSVNRDLHAAIRRGDERVTAGPGPGQFVVSGVDTADAFAAPCPRSTRASAVVRVERLEVKPLASLVEARGGLRACGIRHHDGESAERRRWVERLLRGYLRSRARGWIGIYDADEISVKAVGLHPSQVWGDEWWEAIDEARAQRPVQTRARTRELATAG